MQDNRRRRRTVIQDIATQVPDALEHEQPTDPATPWHKVVFEAPARQWLGERLQVNSTHHQAVEDAGTLAACGWSGDGIVEAIADPATFALGVQWHPGFSTVRCLSSAAPRGSRPLGTSSAVRYPPDRARTKTTNTSPRISKQGLRMAQAAGHAQERTSRLQVKRQGTIAGCAKVTHCRPRVASSIEQHSVSARPVPTGESPPQVVVRCAIELGRSSPSARTAQSSTTNAPLTTGVPMC